MAATHEHHPQAKVPTEVLDGAVKEYSRDRLYVIVAVVLTAITAVEVSTYYLTDIFKDRFLVATLLILAAVKFFLVAYVFMHLRFDKKVLTTIFYAGIALALALYLCVLTVFRYWTPDFSAIKDQMGL
ncbi:MAG: cytochrome C oxidase subunit IV family protein [Acidimicrobiales bacterium]